MPTVLRSSLNTILGAIAARIQTKTGLGPEAVYPALRPALVYQADKAIQLVPKEFSVDHQWTDGSSRRSTKIDRYIWVVCNARCALDPSPEATQLLTNPTLGLVALTEAVADALHDWLPLDGAGNSLTICPLQLWGGMGELIPPDKDDPTDHGQLVLVFQVSYQAPLNQFDPNIFT